MEVIKAESITKKYVIGEDSVQVLKGINLSINKGEMIALTGSSGSGKSTLMNILGCLDRSDSGDYFIAGEKVSSLSNDQLAKIRNKHIGFVFQTFNLLSRMSALENVELPLLYAGLSNEKQKAMETLEIVGLKDRIYHEPNQLSGGQNQRVAIARAIICNPDIILADEPTGNLDSKTSIEIMNLLMKLNNEGKTIVIVTHEPDIAAYCNRQIRMVDGVILEPK